MTDNYQIDKNSKLFQKFLSLKNKPADPTIVPSQPPPTQPHPRHYPSTAPSQSEPALNFLPGKANEKPQLHVTIGDIEEAASLSFQEQQYPTTRTNPKQSPVELDQRPAAVNLNELEAPLREEFEMTMKEEYSSTKPFEFFKPEKPRERRNRDFNDKHNRSRQERPFRMNESLPDPPKQLPPEPTRYEDSKREKENLMSLNEEQVVKEENMFTLGSREGEYRKKYEKIQEKYQQLKETVQKQRKQRQQELNDKEAEIQLIREKYFELRSNEDTLTTDLKRLKDKLQSENMMRTKFEEEVKELTFKLQEMEDMLQGKEGSLKKKSDEAGHWKAYSEQLKAELKLVNTDIQKLEDRCQYLQSENKMMKKDVTNKESLIEELRKNINSLIEENNIAKDEIYKLTIKAYQFEQQNQIIKGDLMRHEQQHPHINAIQENFMRSIETLSPKRRERQQRTQPERQQRPERAEREPAQGNNRRREFARERAVTSKPERQERPAEREERREERPIHPDNQRQEVHNERRTEPPAPKHNRQAYARIQYLQAELERRKEQKAMTGKLRREKIEMQRELEELLGKINQ